MIRKLLIGLFLLSSITSAYAGIETDTLTSTTLKNSGNVGIGTTNPIQKLDIIGNIAVSGTVDGVDLSTIPNYSVTALKTSNYNAAVGDYIPCDTSGGSFTVTLPTAPADKSEIQILIVKTSPTTNLIIQAGGTDKFDRADGPQTIYMYYSIESLVCKYQSSTGIWFLQSAAAPLNFATGFPGISANTPITNADVSINTTSRELTINTSRGFFDIYVDGGGKVTRTRKNGAVTFPAFTDTSGSWYFYFNSSGTAVTTQVPWSTVDFESIVPVYRILWNSSLSGSDKLVAQYVEYHPNDISADDHQWYHLQGTQWIIGGTMANNAIVSGAPNADGRNSVIGLTSITNVDDNLIYTITNSTGGSAWQQDLGNTTPASLNATNSAQFKIFTQDSSSRVSFLSATRYPFAFNGSTNVPQYITSTGTRSPVSNNYYFVYFVYATQNPISGEAIKIVSAPSEYSTITNARAVNWIDIQNTYSIFGNDLEIRPLYRLIFEYRTSYDVGAKYSALRETQDLRKAAVTTTVTATGSIPATSVTVSPVGSVSSTNAQSAIEELDTEKVGIIGGNVGIGTTDPTQKLDVNGAIKLAGNIVLNGNWLSNDNGNEGVYVDSSGNVGIGTTGTTTAQFNTGSIRIGTSTTSGYVLTADNTGIGTWQVATSGTSSSYRRSFTNGDLSAGSLTVTHSLGQKYCQVTIYDDSDEIVIATGVVATDSNTTTIDLSEFGTISGTWNVVVTK